MRKITVLFITIFLAFPIFSKENTKSIKRVDIKKTHPEKWITEDSRDIFLPENKNSTPGYKGKANEQDSLALVALYNTTDGPNWNKNTNWLTGNVADWFGIVFDISGRVSEIHLYENQLNGIIPPEIGNLSSLKILDLGWNQLSGPIPSELGNLINLEWIELYFNKLSGSIPPELGNLANLQYLTLYFNHLSGNIPSELGNLANLIRLSLHGNDLTGNIPPELGNLSSLEYLKLYDNQLTGNIPPEIGNLSNLGYLYLNENNLTGSIPPELGNLLNLEILDLSWNNLDGTIPPEIGNLTKLRNLSIWKNQITGSVPTEIGNLVNLTYLSLVSNKLEDLPDLSTLINLGTLDVFYNKLTFEDLEPNMNINADIDFDYDQTVFGILQHLTPNSGDNIEFVANVGGSSNIYSWYRGGVFLGAGSSNKYTITNYNVNIDPGVYYCRVTNTKVPDLEVVAIKAYVGVDITKYNISVSANSSNGGTVTGGGTYDDRTIVNLTATPKTGYSFVNWTDYGAIVSKFNNTSITVERNKEYVANFKLQSFSVSASVSVDGGGTKSGSGIYNYGESATLIATPSAGYVFDNWTYNGTIVSTSSTLNVTIYQDMNFIANFKKSSSNSGQTFYVKPAIHGGNDGNNGLSWATAMANPQTAINTAEAAGGGEVWIASGTYNPTLTKYGNSHPDSTRYYSFTMKNEVKVYGGFMGIDIETTDSRMKSDRDGDGTIQEWEYTNETIFSGEIQNDADSSNNSYHIVLFPKSNDGTALLNGIGVESGYSEIIEIGPTVFGESNVYSSGIYAWKNALIENCIVSKCYSVPKVQYYTAKGGGVFLSENSKIENSLIKNCSATSGGGIYSENKSTVINSTIISCFAFSPLTEVQFPAGGGIYNSDTSNVISCTVSNCYAKSWNSVEDTMAIAGGIYNSFQSTVVNCNVFNCTVWGGQGAEGGGIWNAGNVINTNVVNCSIFGINIRGGGIYNEREIVNSIVWGNVKNNTDYSEQVYNYSYDGVIYGKGIYSALQELDMAGDGNINLESVNMDANGPQFILPTNFNGIASSVAEKQSLIEANWGLTDASVCIDAGNNDDVPDDTDKDIIGNERIINGIVDIGAYENGLAAFSITQQPESKTIEYGENIAFSVEVVGNVGAISYQWQKDEVNITGASSNIYIIDPVEFSDSGDYRVLVTDETFEILESEIAILKVTKANPTITIWPTPSGSISFGEDLSGITLSDDGTVTSKQNSEITSLKTNDNKTVIVYTNKNVTSKDVIAVTGVFSFKDPSVKPNAGIYNAPIIFTPDDIEHYNPVESTIEIVVNKATPEAIFPTATLNTGDNLANALFDGATGDGMFEFDFPETIPTESGNFPATFIPNDLVNYLTIGGFISVELLNANISITVNAGLGGNVTPGSTWVSEGSDLTFTITCASSYKIETATYNGINVLNEIESLDETIYSFTLKNITKEGTFDITFMPKTFNITVTSNPGGTVSPTSSTVSYGSGQVFTMIPMNYGFGIIKVLYNDVNVTEELEQSENQYTYFKQNIQEDGELGVTFGLIEYSLIALSNEGGVITPDTVSVYHGTNQTFTIKPNEGYHISEFTFNGIDKKDKLKESAGNYTYMALNVIEDAIIEVVFSNSTGIGLNSNTNFNIYPNPAENNLRILLPEHIKECKLSIVDINGRPVFIENNFTETEINLNELPSGVYQVVIEFEKQILTKRLIKK